MRAVRAGVSLGVLAQALALSVAWGGAASAQATQTPAETPSSAAGSEVSQLPEVVVTANKREQRLQDVPASITAETGATLDHRGATQLEDIIRTTPGLTNAGIGGGNSTDLTIRGVTSGGVGLKQSTVSLLFDDIPLDPATTTQSATNLRTVDIQRVEVLRGPQGTLFGSGSLSGALRFITNKPDLERYSASGEITGAGTDGGAGSVWGNLVLNAPIVEGRLGVRLVGYGFNEGGWVDDIRTLHNNVNGNRTSGGRLEVEAKPIDHLTVTFTGAYQDSRDLGAGESLYTEPKGYPSDDQVTTRLKSTDLGVISKITNLGLRYELPEVTLFSSSTFIRRETIARDDTGFYNDLIGSLVHINALIGASAPTITYNNQNTFTQEVRASSNARGPLKWTVGAFYLNADLGGGQTIDSPAFSLLTGTPILANLVSQGFQTEVSGFGEATYTLANKLDLTAGLRVSYTALNTDTSSAGVLLTNAVSPTTVVASQIRQHDTTENPRFSAAYRASRDLTLYATAARGYRVGGPNLTAALGGPGIPTSYNSDHLWNYETGAKGRLLDGRLTYSGDLYYIDWSDIQVALVKNSVQYTGNAGSARVYGLEFETAAKATSWLDVGGSLSVSRGELSEDDPTLARVTGTVGVKSGDRLPNSPAVEVSAFSQVNFQTLGHDSYLRLADSYISNEYSDFASQGTRFGDFQRLDARLGFTFNGYEVVAFVDNLTNSGGATAAADTFFVGAPKPPNPGSLVAVPQVAYRIRPRTAGLTFRAHF